MKIRFYGLLNGMCCILLSACVTQPPPVTTPDLKPGLEIVKRQELEQMKTRKMPPDSEHVKARLAYYEKRLAVWQELDKHMALKGAVAPSPHRWGQCGAAASELVEAFAGLRSQLQADKDRQATASKGLLDPWEVHRLDIQFVEGGCDAVIDAGTAKFGGLVPGTTETAEAMLGRYYGEGKYEEAIEIYRDLQLKAPRQATNRQVKKIYGMSLLRTRRVDAASQVLPSTLEPLDKNVPESWSQRRLVADLYLATGKLKQAQEEYKRLNAFFSATSLGNGWDGIDLWVADQLQLFQASQSADEEQGLNIFMTVMRSFILFDGKRMPESLTTAAQRLERIFPNSKYAKRSQQILWQAEDQVRSWVRGQLLEVDNLVEGKEFDKALVVLDGLLAEELPVSLRDEVKKIRDDVILAAARNKKAKEFDPAALAAHWEEALNLFELHRYDEALEAFNLLLGTEFEPQAREKIIETSDIAAKVMRRQAASIFVRAKKSNSIERKKEMLVESWQMLAEISDRYPMSTILEKVLQNMQVIEDEIREFFPSLLNQLEKRADGEKGLAAEGKDEEGQQKIVEEPIL